MLSYSAEVVLQMLLPEIERLGAKVVRLCDEADARDRAMADLAMEIARLRANLERVSAGGAL